MYNIATIQVEMQYIKNEIHIKWFNSKGGE